MSPTKKQPTNRKRPAPKRRGDATPERAALLDAFMEVALPVVWEGMNQQADAIGEIVAGVPEQLRAAIVGPLRPSRERIIALAHPICVAFARAVEQGGAAALAAVERECAPEEIRPLLFRHFVDAFMQRESAQMGPLERPRGLSPGPESIRARLLFEMVDGLEHAQRLDRRRATTRDAIAKETVKLRRTRHGVVESRSQRMGGRVAKPGTAFARALRGRRLPWPAVVELVRAFFEPDLPPGAAGVETLRQRTKGARNLAPKVRT